MKRTNLKIGLGAVLGLLMGLGSAHALSNTDPHDGTITVTPIGLVELQLSPTFYAFGALDVATSSNSATALTLSNPGSVNVTVEKRITDESVPNGWDAVAAVGLVDEYVLYGATSTARPGLSEFGSGTEFTDNLTLNDLTGSSGTGSVPNIDAVSGSVDLWFKIDMPTSVSSQASRTIEIEFDGTAL